MQLQNPFKELDWSDLKTFSQPFSNLVSKSEELILSKNGLEPAIKRSLLNFTLKYIKKSLSNKSLLDICSPTQELEFKKRLEYLINMIGSETISSFNYSITELLKSGCIKINKGSRFNNTIDFIQYDEHKQLGLFRYYSSDRHSENFYLENNEIIPQLDKTIEHKIFTDTFSFERRIWISLVDDSKHSKITCNIDGKKVKIRDLNRKINDYLEIDKSLENLKKIKPSFNIVSNYKDCWVLMDRDNQADDNAEHLYRFINNNRKDIDAYFVIRNDSHDWTRLKSEGFKLLAYGSSEHEIALESCSRVISSHAAQFATDYFKDKRMLWKKFIFLQHGVIHNDQSALFKPDWKRFDIFVTSSPLEYESISGELSSYKFTRKEVKLTGLPRHDALIKSKIEKEKIILVMPTWRPSLLGKVISGTERELIPNFLESDYYKAWFSLLVNNGLRDFAKKTGYRIIFFPHANIQPYLSEISLPGDIEVMSHASGSIQELFLKASIMITDYSSVAFEMAYLGKPVCYYQFDEREFFSKGHYNKGYFDYRNDGFGPVIKDEQEVISFITDTIKNDCAMQTIYLDKSVSFFPFKDGNCCQRVLNEIENLDDIELNNNDSINYLTESAENAFKEGLWYQATIRYEKLLSINTNENRKNHSINNYFISLQNLGYGMKLEILAASNNEYKESFSPELMLRGDIINDLLFDQNKSLDYPDFPLNYKRDFEIYNLLKNNSINETLFSFNYKLQSKETLNLNNKPKESSNLNELIELDVDNINCIFFKKSHLMLYLLSIQNKHESVIDYYNNLPYRDRAYILNKYLFLLSLKALKKWGKILQNIGDDPVLQGRTGIANFATIYFFAINYAKTIITDIEDYDYILNNSEELDFNKVSDIAKYHLLTNNDFIRAGMLIEKNVKICDSRIFEFYIRALCRENLQTKAYHLLKECEVADLTQNNMILLGISQ
ncbi:CDP-glycerol glycerophosphotransferase family protein [Ewingella americana]|uniref:CDP-glycerol glycerophosphotransferase family protein n=1 Tax=Ewingella americana TaxID=41202 RepID=UPI00163A37CE|nr:CDP-glycerol glycerophosphotransferase family protein [Ewingella americana]QMV52380.1 hypothetical protein GXP68_14250 [Ewingella americana]